MIGLVYLVQPSGDIGTNCYKIGMSSSNTIKRIRSYGRGCVNIVSRECANPVDVERYLIEAFTHHFGAPSKGREWFCGNKRDMITIFDDCYNTHAQHVDEELYNNDPDYSSQKFTLDALEAYVKEHVKYTQSNRNKEPIDQEIFDIFNILPDSCFHKQEWIYRLIHVMRNDRFYRYERNVITMRYLMNKRSELNCERVIMKGFTSRMNSKEQRFGLCALKKIIKYEYPASYETWLQRWDPKKSNLDRGMVYKKGALTKLSVLKAACKKRNLTASKLLDINSEFTVSKKHICKSCLNKHVSNCCSKYKREASTTCMFVNNIELV